MIELTTKERLMLKELERESLRVVVTRANMEENEELIRKIGKKVRKNWEKMINFSDG